jgi:predicted permease
VFDILILAVMLAILVSLGSALYFLVRDRGGSERTVISLSIRVALAVLLLLLLAWGFITRFPVGG